MRFRLTYALDVNTGNGITYACNKEGPAAHDALKLSMPWWEYGLRGIVVYLGLLVLLRLTGKRSLSDMSPVDIVVLILVGGTLRTSILGSDTSFPGDRHCQHTVDAKRYRLARRALATI